MRTAIAIWVAVGLIVAFSVGCTCAKKDAEPESAAETAPTPASKPRVAKIPTPTADELPVEADFEDAAEQEITAETYRKELDALEAEIGVEPAGQASGGAASEAEEPAAPSPTPTE